MMLDIGRFLELTHKDYGLVFYEIMENNQPCPYCGGDDAYVLEVAVDNDTSKKDDVFYPPDARVGISMTVCDKVLQKELKTSKNQFRLQPQKYDDLRRQLIIDDNKDI